MLLFFKFRRYWKLEVLFPILNIFGFHFTKHKHTYWSFIRLTTVFEVSFCLQHVEEKKIICMRKTSLLSIVSKGWYCHRRTKTDECKIFLHGIVHIIRKSQAIKILIVYSTTLKAKRKSVKAKLNERLLLNDKLRYITTVYEKWFAPSPLLCCMKKVFLRTRINPVNITFKFCTF